jgi:hypothetical protein
MAFQEPPTFVDGEILSASQLNILATNQNYLADAIATTNMGFAEAIVNNVTTDIYYELVHTHDNLYVRANLTGGSDLHIYYGATKIVEITDSGQNAENVDLTSFGFTKGQRYRVRFAWAGGGGSTDNIEIQWAGETATEL